ncbi:MAG: MFS transporter [Chloroflexi bacterium]|nr:MFS transporter [Chloroflexota bacterium]
MPSWRCCVWKKTDTVRLSPSRAWRSVVDRFPPALWLALAIALCFHSSMNILTAPLPLYVTHLGGGATEVGLAAGLLAGFALLMRLPVGWMADGLPRWWLLFLGCMVFLATSFGLTLVATVPAVLALRTLQGLGLSAFSTGYSALAADLARPGRNGEALGLAGIAAPFAMLYAPALGEAARLQMGFRPAFLLAALAALAGLVLLLWLPRRSGHAPQPLRQPASHGQPQGRVRPSIILALALSGAIYAVQWGFMPTFAVERNQLTAGPFFSAMALATVGARLGMGSLSDRLGRRLVMIPGLALQAFSLWVLAAMTNWWWMIAAGMAAGLGMGAARAALEGAIVDDAHAAARGRAFNLAWVGYDVGITAGAMAVGPVADALGYGAMFGVAGGVSFLLVGLFILATGD